VAKIHNFDVKKQQTKKEPLETKPQPPLPWLRAPIKKDAGANKQISTTGL